VSFQSWLHYLCSAQASSRGQGQQARRASNRAPKRRPILEALEDRSVPAFLAPVDYSVGWSPAEVKAADFNGDHYLDLATLDLGSNTVSVLLGNPGGSFQPARSSYAGNGYPLQSLAVGDFNEDGKLDLATGSNLYETYQYGVDDVIVLLGNGDGSFRPPVYLGTDLPAVAVATGDLNGDGNTDLFVAAWDDTSQSGSLNVVLGHGDGTFAPATTVGPNDGYPPSPVLADFDGDGDADVALGSQLLLSNGDGTFRAPGDLGAYSYGWTVADLDGDRNLDLAGTTFDGGYGISVLLGKGDGSFQNSRFFVAGLNPGYVNAADMDGDRVVDLVVTNQITTDGGLTVLLGEGDGSFAPPITTAVAGYPGALVVADFNGNGLPDAAVTNSDYWNAGSVSVFFNDGTWPPADPPSVSIRDFTVTEGNAGTINATFIVTLSHTATADVTVHFETANITATAGSDYTATSGTLIIPAGQLYATIEIAVRGDRLPEPTETFAVNLSAATNATIGDGQGIVTIFDDEPVIRTTDVTRAEGRKPYTTVFTFTVTIGAPYDQPVTVSFRTVDGTATTSNKDYDAKTGTLTFAPGETTKTITIFVNGDNKRESDETFFVDLFGNSGNSRFGKSRGVGTIVNDD
jgi:hypothetical protein